MTDGSIEVIGSWRSRAQTLQNLAGLFEQQIDVLRSLCPSFKNWYSMDPVPGLEMNDQNFQQWPLEELRDGDLVKLMTDYTRVINCDTEEPSGRNFYLTVSTEEALTADSEDVFLSLSGGVGWERNPLPCEIKFANCSPTGLTPDLMKFEFIRRVVDTFIDIWRPDLVKAAPSILSELFGFPPRPFRPGWIVALSPEYADQITAPLTSYNERRADGYLVMSATRETFDVNNPDHIARARAIGDAVAPLNEIVRRGFRAVG